MKKIRDILKEKAKSSQRLNYIVENEAPANDEEETKTITKDGEKVLVFRDPLYSREKRAVINYAVFRGKWEFEELDRIDEEQQEKCAVKFSPETDGSNLTLAFNSISDRVEFMGSIFSDNEMKHVEGESPLTKLANSKVLKTTGGIIGAAAVAYGIFKLFSKEKE